MADHRSEERRELANQFLDGQIEVCKVSEQDEGNWRLAAELAGMQLETWITVSLRCAALYTIALDTAGKKGGK